MKPYFDHEKLHAYQQSLAFIRWVTPVLEKIPKNLAVWGQLDRASTSPPLNIAEGNGKFTAPDRCKYFDIARGSSLESAAAWTFWSQKANSPRLRSRQENNCSRMSSRCWWV